MKTKKIPQRMCVACQEMKNKKDLIRVVLAPTGEVSIDKTGKKSGRGAYLCLTKECVLKAKKGKNLERVLKTAVPEEIYEQLLEMAEDDNDAKD